MILPYHFTKQNNTKKFSNILMNLLVKLFKLTAPDNYTAHPDELHGRLSLQQPFIDAKKLDFLNIFIVIITIICLLKLFHSKYHYTSMD